MSAPGKASANRANDQPRLIQGATIQLPPTEAGEAPVIIQFPPEGGSIDLPNGRRYTFTPHGPPQNPPAQEGADNESFSGAHSEQRRVLQWRSRVVPDGLRSPPPIGSTVDSSMDGLWETDPDYAPTQNQEADGVGGDQGADERDDQDEIVVKNEDEDGNQGANGNEGADGNEDGDSSNDNPDDEPSGSEYEDDGDSSSSSEATIVPHRPAPRQRTPQDPERVRRSMSPSFDRRGHGESTVTSETGVLESQYTSNSRSRHEPDSDYVPDEDEEMTSDDE